MTSLMIISRNCTTFSGDKSLDEAALRRSLERFVESRVVVYLCSGGSGEANALTRDEMATIYRVGAEVFRGVLPVHANIPEVSTPGDAIDFARLAVDCGAEVVNMYGPASIHGFVPNDDELDAWFDAVLPAIDVPVVVAPNPVQGYTPSAAVIAGVVQRHEHVTGVNLVGLKGDAYFLELRERLSRPVDLNVGLPGSRQCFDLGAVGLICNLANILPRTVRAYVDQYEAGDLDAMGRTYAALTRFERYCNTTTWRNPRWQKMALRVLNLPGGSGGLRPPFLMPSDAEVSVFADGLSGLGIPELDELLESASA
jgi:dihydrodipicolinate synthase/N-acetylneuraminate lyase